MSAMMVVFEVFVAPGASPDGLISVEMSRDTGAQVMTIDQARKVGFSGIEVPEGREVRLIAVGKRDAPWIHRSLETNEAVASFRVHEVD
jgi:hypothetical protein